MADVVRRIIDETLPANREMWDEKLLPLCWALRAVPNLAAAEGRDLLWVVGLWRGAVVAKFSWFRATRAEIHERFLHWWENVAFAKGQRPIDFMAAEARNSPVPLPSVPAKMRVGATLFSLARLCRRLSEDGRVFILSCRMAGELIGFSYRRAAASLRRLVFDLRWLELIEMGDWKTGLASSYRWTGGVA
jgi:hypothetical protein